MAAKKTKKKAAPRAKAPAKKATAKPKAKVTTKPKAKPAREPSAVAKKPKRPAKANPIPKDLPRKTIMATNVAPPPKPKATISRAKAVALANTFFAKNLGHGALYAPRASRFRLGNISDRNGVINIAFCHEGLDGDPVLAELGAKCLEALLAAHPQLVAFELETQTIRM
jgi:hypothetical protein